ncbi:MAG: Maf family protein [Spirochaetia bacterium]|jgi:septum formation protein
METIILASGSPRRKELLVKAKMPVKVIPPDLVEDYSSFESSGDLVSRVARSKVEAVVELFKTESPRWVLGVDTIVEVDGKVLGKPAGPEEARAMLGLLSGKTHKVYSGVAVLIDKAKPIDLEVVSTDVQFKTLTPAELAWYVECGEWSGAAGAYRIQERGAFFVEWIRGSYSNVVGLPLEAFYGILIRNEYHF